MERCPKCKSTKFCKDGIVKGKQRFKCKDCSFRFRVEHIGKPEKLKRDALILYLEGLGFRSIGRFLKVSHVTVFKWIKAYGKKLDEIRSNEAIEVVEIDEMHTYIGSKKNYCWIWIAVDRDGRKFINCEVGTRGTETGEKLWKKIEPKIKGKVCTDYWKAYEAFVPDDIHIQSKADTFTVEGYNSLLRHFLARLRRKTKCYSKVVYMLVYSVKLLMFKWNNGLSILF
ncbi:MAG: IS1 family transposase [Microscillaceae bacterium]|nr:IS1 family transposase [Microscillaceae bacterium]MDW8461625.1 IS1 family transposase [Cytophagales bacterium]